MQAHQPLGWMIECSRDGAQDREAQRLPQVHCRLIGLHNRVELDAVVVFLPGPLDRLAAQRSSYAAAAGFRVDQE